MEIDPAGVIQLLGLSANAILIFFGLVGAWHFDRRMVRLEDRIASVLRSHPSKQSNY